VEALPPHRTTFRPLGQRVRDWITWFGTARLVVTALSVLAVGGGAYWLVRVPAPSVESSLPRAGGAGQSGSAGSVGSGSGSRPPNTVVSDDGAPTTTQATVVVVHVAGAVAVPGVYRLPAGARVIDAVAAAGGAAAGARLDAINLATPLRDGDRLYVPLAREVPAVVPGVSSSSGEGASGGAQGPVNLNTATLEQLQTLPGVGPATAAAIVSHRERNGPFASVEALGDVHGIGPAKLDVLRPLVSI